MFVECVWSVCVESVCGVCVECVWSVCVECVCGVACGQPPGSRLDASQPPLASQFWRFMYAYPHAALLLLLTHQGAVPPLAPRRPRHIQSAHVPGD